MKRHLLSACFLLLCLSAPAWLSASGGEYYGPSYTIPYGSFNDSVQVSGDELEKVLGTSWPRFIWESSFQIKPSMEDTYQAALALEKAGDTKGALKLFRRIDSTRFFNCDWVHSSRKPLFIFREAEDRLQLYTPERLKQPKLIRLYLSARQAYTEVQNNNYDDAHTQFQALHAAAKAADPADKSGFQSLASYMEIVIRTKMTTAQDAGVTYLQYLDKHPSDRAIMTLATDFTFPEGQNLVTPEQTAVYLKKLLKDYPASRYADDAAYLLAGMAITRGDWAETQKYFRMLAEKFNEDDMVWKGKLTDLADRAAGVFQKPNRSQVFWELAGGEGDYDGSEDQWNQVKPFYRPYLIMARIQGGRPFNQFSPMMHHKHKKAARAMSWWHLSRWRIWPINTMEVAQVPTAPSKKNNKAGDGSQTEEKPEDSINRWLEEIVQKYPNHPLWPAACASMAYNYQEKIGWDRSKPEAQEAIRKSLALYKQLFSKYPAAPSAGYVPLRSLELLFWRGGVKNENAWLVSTLERAHQFHLLGINLYQGVPDEVRKGPLFKDPQMMEMYYVANENYGSLVQEYPQSKFALWSFLKLFNDFENEKNLLEPPPAGTASDPAKKQQYLDQRKMMQKGTLTPLLAYAKWFLKNRPADPQAETVKVKLAKVHLETGNAKLALAETESILPGDTAGYWKDEALWVRARALESLGREKQALKAFAEFARLYPHDGQPFTGMNNTSYADTYAGYLNTSPRPAGKSPYTDYALGKIGLHDESVKNYVEALKIYLDMDDVADASDLLENKMPIPDMEKFAAQYPDHPALELVKYSTGIRYFRGRNYDQALLYLGTDPKAQDVKNFRKMLGDLESLKDPGERARAEYKMAQYFFHSNRSIFTNDRLPGGQWMAFGAKSAPATGQDPGALFLSNDPMGSAAQEFKHVAEAYPDSPFAPRALYSYALCLLRHPDLKDPEGKTFVDKFRELAEKYPLDTLSDDALLWAYFFGRDDKDLAALAKNPNHGDVMLFFNTESMRKEYGQKWDYPHWWQMFYKHNEYLSGTDVTDESKAALLGSQLDDQYNQGGPYSGWYYYKATGKEPYDATLNLTLQGADDSDMTVNFNGREQTLAAHTPKAFHFKVAGLTPGVAQWINFRVAEASSPSINVSGSIQAQVDGQPYESPLDPVTAVSHAVSLDHQMTAYPVDPACQVETAFALNGDSYRPMRWAFKKSDGKTVIYNYFGKYMYNATQVVDEEIHQFLKAENGAEIHVGDLSQALAKDKPVAVCRYYTNAFQVKPLYPLPPYGRYAHGKLSVADGQLVDERGEAVADLPDELKPQATPVPGLLLRRRQRLHTHPAAAFEPQVEIKPGEPGNDQHLVVWGLSALGLAEDSRSCYPGPEKVTEAHYLGVDHAGNLYFYLRTPADDKVQVFYPNGKPLGLFWLKDVIGRVDDFGKLKYQVFTTGKVRFYSFLPDQKSVLVDEFLFDHIPSRSEYVEE